MTKHIHMQRNLNCLVFTLHREWRIPPCFTNTRWIIHLMTLTSSLLSRCPQRQRVMISPFIGISTSKPHQIVSRLVKVLMMSRLPLPQQVDQPRSSSPMTGLSPTPTPSPSLLPLHQPNSFLLSMLPSNFTTCRIPV